MPRLPRRGRLLAAVTTLAVPVAVAAVAAPAAWAEDPVVTAQARIANAEFLAFAPPPAEGAGAVCLVDTGVDLNPDTESNVIERLALDGGDPGDVYHAKHGTEMAMVMGGPVNDWGSVGIWPHVRIVSVRAMPPGESSFPFSQYRRAADMCRKRAALRQVLAINLSLGGAEATQREIAELTNLIEAAGTDGLNVVAAAGNDRGPVQYPAAIAEAFAVGAAEATGEFCSFSSRGPELDILAPGCQLDVSLPDGQPAQGSGTSDGSAFVAAILTALRSYRPDLDPEHAETLLLSTSRSTSAGRALDVEAAFRAAGLDEIVDAGSGHGDEQSPTAPRQPGGDARRPSIGATKSTLPRPRLRRAQYARGRLTLTFANRPRGAVVVARISYGTGRGEFRRRVLTVERAATSVRVRAPTSWRRLEVEYRSLELPPSRRLVVTRRVLARRSNTRPAHLGE